MSMKLKVTNTRVGFAHGLFKASAFEEGQQAKYGADFILTPEAEELLAEPAAEPQRQPVAPRDPATERSL